MGNKWHLCFIKTISLESKEYFLSLLCVSGSLESQSKNKKKKNEKLN